MNFFLLFKGKTLEKVIIALQVNEEYTLYYMSILGWILIQTESILPWSI